VKYQFTAAAAVKEFAFDIGKAKQEVSLKSMFCHQLFINIYPPLKSQLIGRQDMFDDKSEEIGKKLTQGEIDTATFLKVSFWWLKFMIIL
jgi:hypothetical protein